IGSRTARRITRSVLMLTTAGKTFATAKTAGSAAGSPWPKHDVDLANPQSAKVVSANRLLPCIPICAVQITGAPRHCQLAARANGCRLNLECERPSPLEQTWN